MEECPKCKKETACGYSIKRVDGGYERGKACLCGWSSIESSQAAEEEGTK